MLGERELGRRIDKDRAQGRPLALRMLRSRNDQAAVVALRVARERTGTVLEVPDVLARAEAPSTPLAVQVAASAYLVDRAPDDAARLLRRIAEHGLDARTVTPFVRSVLALPTDSVGEELVVGAVSHVKDDVARERLVVAREVAGEIRSGRSLAVVAEQHRDAPYPLEVLAAWADPDAPVSELQGLGRVVLSAHGVDPDARVRLARTLRSAGDFSVSTELASTVLEEHPANPRARLLVNVGRSMLTTLDEGWSPPVRTAAATTPPDGVIPYLLHSALPQVSMGYATRTHGLLGAVRSLGWDVQGVTRPGYPVDVPGAEPASKVDIVDEVPYHHLLEGRRTFPVFPVERAVEDYSRLLTSFLADRRPRLVHAASNYRNGAAAVTVARELGVPSVYEVRGLWEYTRLARQPDYDQTEHWALNVQMETDVARGADKVIAITGALKDVLVERGVEADTIAVVPNGVDTARFAPQERDEALAASLGLDGKTVIGYVGSLLEYEGLELLVEAAASLRTERSDFGVLVVGDGRSLPTLKERAAELGVEDLVVFTGRVPHTEVERYYSIIDVAPFPRLPVAVCELVSPLKPFEAMAMGKLVVASDVAALAEIVTDGGNGRLFTKGSAASLAEVLASTLDDRAARATVAEQGLEWVRAERDWSAVARSVATVYEELGLTP
ncbi:glycosyltransferase [Oerskovia flava]|uniref:glycosyltransferase n=1 Tax=Oerskovia flava TaxID=2986422 RepID=UPI0022406703|nr:glycosyltransferase [Oerskovia sp. JB1-3-2]